MRPSPQKTLLDYGKDDYIPVRVKSCMGKLIIAESIDAAYKPISGKVLLLTGDGRPNMDQLSEAINPGDFLITKLASQTGFAFEIRDAFENFYRDYVCNCAAQKRLAIYVSEYSSGTEWITDDGIRIGIDRAKIESLDEDTRESFYDAIDERRPIHVRLYSRAPNRDRPLFNVYAEPDLAVWNDPIDPTDQFTIDEANIEMVHSFLYEAEQRADTVEQTTHNECLPANPQVCASLIPIIYGFITSGLSSCRTRLEYTTAVAMLCHICERREEYTFMEHERKYLYAQVQFAANRELSPLSHTPELDGVEIVTRREQIIRSLAGYKKKKAVQGGTIPDIVGDQSVQAKIDALVTASNNLIDIIDTLELNNIKQVIARALSIEDEYVSILDDRTFYGTESISLEFKTSVVFPPANRRRLASAVADPDMQKWAILKAVCGFLNSRSGGELLIGVNDTGYAVGLDDDMRKLTELRCISSPDIDHYRTYLQNLLDQAFTVGVGKTASADITRTHVLYLPEVNAEGKTIMRIKIEPYRRHIVAMAAPATERPRGIEDAYVRLSGRTVAITPAMHDEIMAYKLS